MLEFIVALFTKAKAITLAEKVVVALIAKPITGGVSKVAQYGYSKIAKDSPEKHVEKALKKALKKAALDNEFWKNDVKRQIKDVIQILVHTLDNPQYVDTNPLPNYIDKKTIDCFKDCLKEDPVAWKYIQEVRFEDILKDIKVIRAIATETRDTANEINERTKRIEDKLDNVNISSDCHALTQSPPAADASNVIGREADLQALWDALCKKHHVMLTGFGGIGKTVLAQWLYHEYESGFEEVAWIKYQGNLMKSFAARIDALQIPEGCNTEEKQWQFIERTLRNDGKTKLIVVDNVDNTTDEQLQELTGWKETTVLLTSRLPELEGYEKHSLGSLSKEDCIALFNHYLKGRTATREQAARFAELADWHTLTIELLAKAALQQKDFEVYYDNVKKEFSKADELVKTKHHNVEDTIENHLRFLYNMQQRGPKEKEVLIAMAVLPERCECERKELEDWFGFKESDWHALMRDGWLAFDATSQMYSLHPLVRTIVRFDFLDNGQNSKTIAPDDVADRLMEYFYNNKEVFDIAEGYKSLQRKIEIVNSAMGTVAQEKSQRSAALLNNIGSSYDTLGNYDKALEYHGKALVIKEKIFEPDDFRIGTSYNNIGSVYCKKGEYDKALEYFFKALAIKEKILGTEHPSTATSYDNIGSVYDDQGNYDKALEYHFKALAIYEKVLGTKHPDTATSYNNIGVVYKKQGDYDKALEYYFKALAINEKVLGTEHPDTATSYNNIGAVYRAQGNYDKALEYYFKALLIVEKNLGPEHPNTVSLYNNIGSVYYEMKEFELMMATLDAMGTMEPEE